MYPNIEIDYSRDEKLTNFAKRLLEDHYMLPDEKSPQEAFARASLAYCYGDYALAQRIYDYASKGWFMFASPVLSNAPVPGKQVKSLPISCYLTYMSDSLEGIIDHSSEVRWLTVKGGGVGGHISSVRSVSDKAPGPIPFLHSIDADMLAFAQGKTRRGAYAAYLDISHPDIEEFISMRLPEGDVNRRCTNLHNAVNITDKFLHAVKNNLDWDLIDPNDKTVRSTVSARGLWQKIIETRFRTGEPYMFYIDEANRQLPTPLQEKGLKINGSNICIEITLPTSPDRTAVCCLSSVNLEYYDQWKDTQMVEDLITLLDNVLQHFIDNASDQISKARYSATRERSIGLGAMGFHSYLQSRSIPLESVAAKSINKAMFRLIKEKAIKQTKKLAIERGEYLDGIGSGRRNSHLIALAPNANNSIIAGASPSIEPIKSNAYTHNTRVGSVLVKNKHLEAYLEFIGHDNEQVWSDIAINGGSVQHLDFIPGEIKEVFKTAFEIDQRWLVDLARDRQEFVCQAQSLNLFFPAGIEKSIVNAVHLRAFSKEGTGVPLKSLYYLRTEAGAKVDKVSEKVERKKLGVSEAEECVACSG